MTDFARFLTDVAGGVEIEVCKSYLESVFTIRMIKVKIIFTGGIIMAIKRKVQLILTVIICLLFGIAAYAEEAEDIWVEHDDVSAIMFGRVAYEDYTGLVGKDYVTYYAKLGGSEQDDITYSDRGSVTIDSNKSDAIELKVYYGNIYTTTQEKIKRSNTSVYVEYSFSSTEDSFTLYD